MLTSTAEDGLVNALPYEKDDLDEVTLKPISAPYIPNKRRFPFLNSSPPPRPMLVEFHLYLFSTSAEIVGQTGAVEGSILRSKTILFWLSPPKPKRT